VNCRPILPLNGSARYGDGIVGKPGIRDPVYLAAVEI
jgi:hypothetical protein